MRVLASLSEALTTGRKREYIPLAENVYTAIAIAVDRIAFDLAALGIPDTPR